MRLDDIEKVLPRLLGRSDLGSATVMKLETLADYKYNEYQQFVPGRRFMESLALWLDEIDQNQRAAAFELVEKRLVFFSRGDMFHFTRMAFPHKVRPQILEWEAAEREIPIHGRIALSRSISMWTAIRRSLFLGLSDGAHLDDFRRSSTLHNEQVNTSYDLGHDRARKMVESLEGDLKTRSERILAAGDQVPPPTFNRIFLIDDFTASGTSFLVPKDGGDWGGKITQFLDHLEKNLGNVGTTDEPMPFVDEGSLRVCLVFYIATKRAIETLQSRFEPYNDWREAAGKKRVDLRTIVVQMLENEIAIDPARDPQLRGLIESYDVEGTWDPSMARGGDPGHQRWGFAGCALPVVLYHNTPNNSIAPLWVYEGLSMPGLFPRIRRHWHVVP